MDFGKIGLSIVLTYSSWCGHPFNIWFVTSIRSYLFIGIQLLVKNPRRCNFKNRRSYSDAT